MRNVFLIIIIFTVNTLHANGLLNDAIQDIKGIERNTALSESIRLGAAHAAIKIERASLLQATRDDLLAKRITDLEERLKTQEKIISNYKLLVTELKRKIANLTQ